MNPFKWLVFAGCAYEISALHDKSRLPTISRLLNICSIHPVARIGTWLWCGAWAYHFLVAPGDQ